jgi:hypothetical protein
MVNAKISLAVSSPSEAVTRTCNAPASPLAAVPINTRVVGLKDNQDGSGFPLERAAEYVNVVPASGSEKVFKGIV